MGVGVVTYTGLRTGLDSIFNNVKSVISGAPPGVLQVLGVMKLDVVLSIVFSAIVARMVLNGLTGETVKKWVTK